jgi:hypothetical protein
MVALYVDPQTTISCPRPMPDQVVIVTCDAAGARCWVTVGKQAFDEMMPGMLAVLEEGTAKLYEQWAEQGKTPPTGWALDPATLAAYDATTAAYLADPANIRPGDTVRFKDPRQQPGVPRSDDVM